MFLYQFDAVIQTVSEKQAAAHKEKVDANFLRFLNNLYNLFVSRFVGVDENYKFFLRCI